MQTGWMYYKDEAKFIKASNVVYMERQLVENFLSNYHHGWMSEESQAEAYNETWRSSTQVELVNKFLAENPHVGTQFNKKMKEAVSEEEMCERLDDEDLESESAKDEEGKKSVCGMFEIHRKNLAQAYYHLWIYEELRERNLVGRHIFGPYYLDEEKKNLFRYKDSVEEFLALVDGLRANEIYSHPSCAGKC